MFGAVYSTHEAAHHQRDPAHRHRAQRLRVRLRANSYHRPPPQGTCRRPAAGNRAGGRCHPKKRFQRRGNTVEKGHAIKIPRTIRRGSISDLYSIGLGRTDDSIHAYGNRSQPSPTFSRSNLNLGLMLVRVNNPEAERYLRAATALKPTAHVEEGQARAWLALGASARKYKSARRAAGLPQSLRTHAEGSRAASIRRSAARTTKRVCRRRSRIQDKSWRSTRKLRKPPSGSPTST